MTNVFITYIGVLFTVQCYTLCLRLCVVLLVKGSAAYNDSRTDAFRRLARRGIDIRHTTVKFMYIDTLKQATFVAKFNHQPTSLRGCPDGTTATPVSMHALCIWFFFQDIWRKACNRTCVVLWLELQYLYHKEDGLWEVRPWITRGMRYGNESVELCWAIAELWKWH